MSKKCNSPDLLKHVFCGRKRELSEFIDNNTFRSKNSFRSKNNESMSHVSVAKSSRVIAGPKYININSMANNDTKEEKPDKDTKEEISPKNILKNETKKLFVVDLKQILLSKCAINIDASIEVPEIPKEFEDDFLMKFPSCHELPVLKDVSMIKIGLKDFNKKRRTSAHKMKTKNKSKK